MLSIRLDVSFVMLLILLSSVSIILLRTNQASAISISAVVGGFKQAMEILSSSQMKSFAQDIGIAPKESKSNTTLPSSSSVRSGLKQDVNQIRQELEAKFKTISLQLDALNEKDKQTAKQQVRQAENETLSHYSAPEQSFLLNTIRELAPQLQNTVCNGGPGGNATSYGGSATANGGPGGKCG